MPPEALKNNFNLLNNEKISFNKILKSKKNISLKSLKERRKYIINGLKKGYYDHHVFHKKKMKIPLKIGDPTLLQLFSHIGYIINLPILFFDSLDKSIHKKKSFKKFYRIINDKKIIQFIKKHEKLRLEWNNINRNHKIISSSLINHLGKNYMYDCLKTLNKIIKKINQLKIPA